MNAHEMVTVIGLVVVAVVVLCLARVIVLALQESTGDLSARLKWLRVIDFALKIVRSGRNPNPARPRKSKSAPTLFFHRWRVLIVMSAGLLMVFVPVHWWMVKPILWRAQLANEFSKLLIMAAYDPQTPVVVPRGKETLDRITAVVDTLTDSMRKNPYRNKEIWVLDHYWQYWRTQRLDEYLNANKIFVANGGKIHRMFLLTAEELRNPEVQALLQEQCRIGRLGAGQTGNGFELWRADPKMINSREEYEGLSRSFRQLPETDKTFNNFDIVRFNDALYYSSDFSPDYRVMGRSIWIFDPEQVSKIDLKSLFKKSIAERIPCD